MNLPTGRLPLNKGGLILWAFGIRGKVMQIAIATFFVLLGTALLGGGISLLDGDIRQWASWPIGIGSTAFIIGLLILIPVKKWKRLGEALTEKWLPATYTVLGYREKKNPKHLIDIEAIEFFVDEHSITLHLAVRNCLSYPIVVNRIEGFFRVWPSNKNLGYGWRPGQQGKIMGTLAQPLGGKWDFYLVCQSPKELSATFDKLEHSIASIDGKLDITTDRLGIFQKEILSKGIEITDI